MALQITANIDVDFYDRKYILINAKQHDMNSRFLSVTCYNHGELFSINSGEHSAYIRYRKSDNNSVFNFCEIDRKGKILVELTEQMLAVDGICDADLLIVNKGSAIVDTSTGEITAIDNASVLSSMPIHINVTETAVNNSEIESTYEINELNRVLTEVNADYQNVVKAAKSWAVGGTDIRDGEDADNAKYYSRQSSNSASAANTSALNAANSEEIAEEHMHETINYYEKTKNIVIGLETGFIPMGTISFSELTIAEKATGYVYNIRDDFVTDDTFAEGAGKSYTAGTNVYYTANGYWDCFGGAVPTTATIDEVKEYLGI